MNAPVKDARPPVRAAAAQQLAATMPVTGTIQLKALPAVKPRTQVQEDYIRAMCENTITFGMGPAGTGKTWLAVAFAVAAQQRGLVDRIILTRPAVEAGEKLGFLPGDMNEKLDPYMRPLYDALHDMLPGNAYENMQQKGLIEIAPLGFMRGRTLSHAFIILDEAQNTTPLQMKMFLTRLGEGSRMVITGDPKQNDLDGAASGLTDAQRVLEGEPDIKFIQFSGKDVVRHPLVGRIVNAYEKGPKGPV